MTDATYGTVQVGRLTLREKFELTEDVHAGTGVRTVNLSGEESFPPLTMAELMRRNEDLMALRDSITAISWTNKSENNGYYQVDDVSVSKVNYTGSLVKFGWTLRAVRIGPDNAVEIESRLTGIARENAFSLTGERWHSPAIGHYAYHTGSTTPTVLSRVGEDGTHVVYRGVPSDANPRWGCPATSFTSGGVRLLIDSLDRTGTGIRAGAATWELNNGLVKVAYSGSDLVVSAWTGGAWQAKTWRIAMMTDIVYELSPGYMTVLRNDNEMVTVRLISITVPGIGPTLIDLTLRRGSRFVEGYIQRGVAPTDMRVRFPGGSTETYTDNSSSGYVVGLSDDAAGNKFIAGSAKSFTANANGGITKTATATLDFFLGVVAGGTAAVTGDQATNLRDQYIGAMAEMTMAVRRG